MVQLQQVQLRLKSVRNIQKITKTMKMVAASKYHKAEKQLAGARPFFYGPSKFYQSIALQPFDVDIWEEHLKQPPYKKKVKESPMEIMIREATELKKKRMASAKELKRKMLYVAVTSDKGFCGGVHSGVGRRIRSDVFLRGGEIEHTKIACIGDKARSLLKQSYPKNILLSCNQLGRLAPEFCDASKIAEAIVSSGYEYDEGDLYYNKYFTAVKYELSVISFHGEKDIYRADNLYAYDEMEDVDCYTEFTICSLIYYALKESSASELSARMSAMDSATKNADEMIRKLALLFNRTRQALITRDLIEIISGAVALTEKDK